MKNSQLLHIYPKFLKIKLACFLLLLRICVYLISSNNSNYIGETWKITINVINVIKRVEEYVSNWNRNWKESDIQNLTHIERFFFHFPKIISPKSKFQDIFILQYHEHIIHLHLKDYNCVGVGHEPNAFSYMVKMITWITVSWIWVNIVIRIRKIEMKNNYSYMQK